MATRSGIGLALVAALLLAGSTSPPRERAPEGRAPTPTELLPAVEAAFTRESYSPGSTAGARRRSDLRDSLVLRTTEQGSYGRLVVRALVP